MLSKKLSRPKRMLRPLNLPSNSNNKPLLLPNNRLKRLISLSNKQSKPGLPKRSKIKSTERMLSSQLCKKLGRRQKHSLRSPERRLKRRLS